jgi:hypothetical protein
LGVKFRDVCFDTFTGLYFSVRSPVTERAPLAAGADARDAAAAGTAAPGAATKDRTSATMASAVSLIKRPVLRCRSRARIAAPIFTCDCGHNQNTERTPRKYPQTTSQEVLKNHRNFPITF